VVPTRGGARRLPKLLDTLRAQTTRDFEVIVVVDGDTDDSVGVLDRIRGDLELRVIAFPENRGRSAALNAGFAAARGSVLIRCDDDLLPGPDYVAGHVARHASARAAVGVIGLSRNVFRPSAYARAYGRSRDIQFRESAYAENPERFWRYWAANVSVTRETFDWVGRYDETYRAYGWEDVDWGYRLVRLGVPIVLAPELETVHTGPAPTTAARIRKAYDSGAARGRFVAKHGSAVFGLDRAGGDSGAGLWGRVVAAFAAVFGRRGLVILGKLVDATADYLPKYVAEKSISLLVESAALSGRRRTADVTTEL
jgi:glycosyltransferase involved in cell wall biosynthesis